MTGDVHVTGDSEPVVKAAVALLRAALAGSSCSLEAFELRRAVAAAADELAAEEREETYATPAAALELET